MHGKVHTESRDTAIVRGGSRRPRCVWGMRANANWECFEGACQLHLLNDISYQRNCRETDLEQIGLTPPYLAYGKPYTHTHTEILSRREQKKCEGRNDSFHSISLTHNQPISCTSACLFVVCVCVCVCWCICVCVCFHFNLLPLNKCTPIFPQAGEHGRRVCISLILLYENNATIATVN